MTDAEPVTTAAGSGEERFQASQEELVEVVDRDGTVVDVTTRERVRRGNLWHRCTYVAVVDAADALVVHRRAEWKDVYPGYWDLCFGGICDVGEPWEAAAARELAEEAGLTGMPLEDLGLLRYDAADGRVVGRVFLVRSDAEPSCPDGEVVAVDRVPLAEIDAWLVDRDVCPDSRQGALPLVIGAVGPSGPAPTES